MTILNTANVVYEDSRGNSFDLMVKDTMRIKTASFHEYEWTKEVTDKRFGERLRAWGKDAKQYPVTILFEGSNREELLNTFHDALEYDLINMSPGTLHWNDYYIECYGISSKTYPDSNDKLATANDVVFYCPSPWWKTVFFNATISPEDSSGEVNENPDIQTHVENVSLTVDRVLFSDGTQSFAVILSSDNVDMREFISLIAPDGSALDISNSRFYPYPSDDSRCYATVNMEEDVYAVIIDCDSNLFYELVSITDSRGEAIDISNSHIYSYVLPDESASQTMTYVTLPDGYSGEMVEVRYKRIVTDPLETDDEDDEIIEVEPETVIVSVSALVPDSKNHFAKSSNEYIGKVLIATYTTALLDELSNSVAFINTNVLPAKYILTIIGPVLNPIVILRNDTTGLYNVISVNATVNERELLIADSSNKTLLLYSYDENDNLINVTNYFGSRDPYFPIWNNIETGANIISWNDNFSFNLKLLEERSEPKWLTD